MPAPWMISLQKWLIQVKPQLIFLFQVAEGFVVAAWLVGATLFVLEPTWRVWLYDLGRQFGVLALGLYLATLVPGIMQRLQFLPLIAAMIMPFRRHLGILMFLTACVHMSLTSSLFYIAAGVPLALNWGQVAGLSTLSVLLPLWLTSNDPSQKYLGKNWKRLHKLTYVALFLVFAHLVLFQKKWLIPTGIMIGFEAWSWFVLWTRAKKTPAPDSQAAPTPPVTQSPPTE